MLYVIGYYSSITINNIVPHTAKESAKGGEGRDYTTPSNFLSKIHKPT